MILSMTGFGEAQLEEAGHAYHVELRSVNNRYFKATLKLPEEFAFMEAQLETLLRKRISRGSLILKLFVRDLSESAAQDINAAAVRHYAEQLRSAVAGTIGAVTIDVAALAALPGVVQPREMDDTQRERSEQAVLQLTEQAIERLVQMRTVEGRALVSDLRGHCSAVRQHLDAILAKVDTVLVEYRQRLHARVQQLLAGSGASLAEADLLKEVAIYAERSDVSEEISRLGSHLAQFDAMIDGSEPAGRKLDFLAQEMLREANTMGSKSGDAAISRHVIEIKGAIDRIKEQVQNAE
jgi:uncharacterized protein (TIGR00255 family)